MSNNNLKKILEEAPNNLIIFDSFVKSDQVVNKQNYKNISIGVSGGSDSDIVLDIIKKVHHDINVHLVFFDTGIEYEATKRHLEELQEKYDHKINVVKAIKPIPVSVREYGSPFISKYVSEMLQRLQRKNFDFANGDKMTFEEAMAKYPKTKSALMWFYNKSPNKLNDDGSIKTISSFNIDRNKHLRSFLINNPPEFKISNKCCYWAKKKVADNFIKENNIDLNIIGVRKSEGGSRSTAYNGCYDRKDGISNYRPIFFYKNADKLEYNDHYDIINSICYSEYGLSRTGCAGCPFARDFEQELEIIKKHEPKLYNAVNKVFGNSYEYTRKYREWKKNKN